MRLEVDSGGYDSAAEALGGGNAVLASAYDTLVGALGGYGGMGGDDTTSEDFVASYDPAAADTVGAFADLATAYGTLATLTASSGANHRDADAGSVYRGSGVEGGADGVPGGEPRTVDATTPPSALGADDSSTPEFWDMIVDHLQGWAWPSADTDRLRQAAGTWRDAAGAIERAPSYGETARGMLSEQRSPEISLALTSITEVERQATDLAAACREMADCCDEYATQVDTTRDTVKGLLRDLAIEIGATAVVSGVASFFTFGGAAAVGAGVAAARIASCARRVIAALRAIKAIRAIGVLASSASKARGIRTALSKFRNLRNLRRRPPRRGGGGKPPTPPKKPTTPSGTQAPSRVRGPQGEDLPGVADGAAPLRAADNGKGYVYDVRGADGINPRVTEVRVMDPVTSGPYPKPNGYVSYMNAQGQAVNPVTGQTIGKADPYWHIELPPP